METYAVDSPIWRDEKAQETRLNEMGADGWKLQLMAEVDGAVRFIFIREF